MRVLLIDPPDLFLSGEGLTRQVLHMGLASLAAVLRSHHDVSMLLPDARSYRGNDPWGEIVRAAAAWQPDAIGITAVTATYPALRRLCTLLARELEGVPLILGGVHVTFRPEEAALLPGVFAVVAGEGEEALLHLLEGLESRGTGRPFDPASLAGVFAASPDGDVREGPEREPIRDLDALPFADREAVLWKDDLEPTFYQALMTLRGCPYRCIYCSVPNGPEGRTRYRSAASVAGEIQLLRDRYEVEYLFFHDSVFTLHRKRTLELCDELATRQLRVPFACQTRADRVDEALLDRLVETGLHQVFFGIESGDAHTLELVRKDMPLEQIRRAVGWVKSRGVRATGFFMIGFPWETRAQIERTADFATGIGLDAVSLFSATPLPGTELWEMTREQPLPESVDFRAPVVNLTALPTDEYAALFHDVKSRVDAYNQAQMMTTLRAWPGSGIPHAP